MLDLKKEFRKLINYKLVLIYIITLILSCINIKGTNPLFISTVFATFSLGIPNALVILIGLIATLFRFGFSQFLFNLLEVAIFIISFFIYKPKKEYEKITLDKNIIFTLLLMQVMKIIKLHSISQILDGTYYIVISYLFYIIFENSIGYLEKLFLKENFVLTNEEICSISILITVLLSVIVKFELGQIIYKVIILTLIAQISYKFGIRTGLVNAIIIGLIAMIISGFTINFLLTLILFAIVLGFLKKLSKIYSFIILACIFVSYIYMFSNIMYSKYFIYMLAISLLTIIISKKTLVIREDNEHLFLKSDSIKKITTQNVYTNKSKINNFKIFKEVILEFYNSIENNRIAKNILKNKKMLKSIFNMLTLKGYIVVEDLEKVLEDNKFKVISTKEEEYLIVKPQLNGLVSNVNLIFENLNREFGYEYIQENDELINMRNDKLKIKLITNAKKKNREISIIKIKLNESLMLIGYVEGTKTQITNYKKVLNNMFQKTLKIESIVEQLDTYVKEDEDSSFNLLVLNLQDNTYYMFKHNSPALYILENGKVKLVEGSQIKGIWFNYGTIAEEQKYILVNNQILKSNSEFKSQKLWIKYLLQDNRDKDIKELSQIILENTMDFVYGNLQETIMTLMFEIAKGE